MVSEVHVSADKIEFFQRVFGHIEHGARDNIQVKCPFCVEDYAKLGIPVRKRKLAIALEKNDVWHCWVCGRRGQIIKVLWKHASHEHYLEYMNRFADKNAIRIHEEEEAKEYIPPPLPADFKMLATNRGDSYVEQAVRYLRKRGVGDRELWYFKFGVAGDWPWANRVIMPSFDKDGGLSYYCGRAMGKAMMNYWDSESRKKHVIFNELHIDWTQELTITEGIFDLVKCNENAVPLLGSDLSTLSTLFQTICKHKTPVLLALDADMTDSKVPWIINALMCSGVRVRVLDMEGYSDVGEMSKDVFMQRREEAEVWSHSKALLSKIQRKIRSRSIL